MSISFPDYLNYVDATLIQNGFNTTMIPQVDRAFYKREFKMLTCRNETYCILKYIGDELVPERVQTISNVIFDYVAKLKKGDYLFCYPIIVTETISEEVRNFIKSYNNKHFSMFEFPVIMELSSGNLSYFTGTPMVGFAMYEGLRNNAKKWLQYQDLHL